MNYLKKDFDSIETGMEELKKKVSIRNQMGGDMFRNILDADCLEIADKLTSLGADKTQIAEIGGWELRHYQPLGRKREQISAERGTPNG